MEKGYTDPSWLASFWGMSTSTVRDYKREAKHVRLADEDRKKIQRIKNQQDCSLPEAVKTYYECDEPRRNGDYNRGVLYTFGYAFFALLMGINFGPLAFSFLILAAPVGVFLWVKSESLLGALDSVAEYLNTVLINSRDTLVGIGDNTKSITDWIGDSLRGTGFYEIFSDGRWHPFITPSENFTAVSYVQYVLGYSRYLLLFPILFDLAFTTFRYYLYPHNQDSYMASWHRWVYYMGGLVLVYLIYLIFNILIDQTIGGLIPKWSRLVASATLTLAVWILSDLLNDKWGIVEG